MDFSTLFTWLKDMMSRLGIAINININSGNNSNNTTVNIDPMNDQLAIKEVWGCIHTDIPVSMPNGKDACWLHASKDKQCGDYFHFGRYFRVPEHDMPDSKPLHFWIGYIHYDNPQLHGMYIWLRREDGRNAPTICGVVCEGNDYHIRIETTDQAGQIIQQMIADILGSIA